MDAFSRRRSAAWLALNLLLALAVVLAVEWHAHRGYFLSPPPAAAATRKFTLYIGTNDKDTLSPALSPEAARARLDGICLKYVDGFTVIPAHGVWRNSRGEATSEVTFVYTFLGAEDGAVYALMDEVRRELNQEAVFMEKSECVGETYSGGKG